MKLNNIWTNEEDYNCFSFNVSLTFSKTNYLDELYEFNKSFHALTWKHRFLMTLSPDYCEKKGIDYINHYDEYLLKNKDIERVLPRVGYEFYEKHIDPVSLIFYYKKDGTLTKGYFHYLYNGLYGNTVYVENGKEVDLDELKKFTYDASPILLNDFSSIKFDDIKNERKVNFSIESHLTIWKDYISGFKYLDENGEIQMLDRSDNRILAYKNTPRLNSFLKDLRLLIEKNGGFCELYDFAVFNTLSIEDKKKYKPNLIKGIAIEEKIVYQENIDKVSLKD